mmetsp:Transcript_21891/g.62317  ORF Transcript_21891/g.62317 Transcript_21891/m.62317 type:complete len:114 (+) Transcript_21891:435-776(+)
MEIKTSRVQAVLISITFRNGQRPSSGGIHKQRKTRYIHVWQLSHTHECAHKTREDQSHGMTVPMHSMAPPPPPTATRKTIGAAGVGGSRNTQRAAASWTAVRVWLHSVKTSAS